MYGLFVLCIDSEIQENFITKIVTDIWAYILYWESFSNVKSTLGLAIVNFTGKIRQIVK